MNNMNEVDLIKVATRQRGLIWLILLSILAMLGFFALISVSSVAVLIFGGFLIIFQLLALIQTFRLSAAMKSGYILPILLIFGIVIPFLGLIMLLLISGQANGLFKAAGVKIGFMGVPKSEYPKLTKGNCPGCGYSRDGLEPLQTCPECGRTPQIH
tara:strand:+ start:352 stop:819 length:468 start_codon:yes stop_codon:yes gene_type:complete